jgi:hypothetical protein
MISLKKLITEAPEDDISRVAKGDLSQTVSLLQKLATDKDFLRVLQHGAQDGDIKDEQIPFKTANVACTDMYPTQAEIGFGNSLDDLCNDKYGAIESAYSSPVLMPAPGERTPILCASVGGKTYILDGHHRWSLCFMINRDAKMACDIMQLGAGTPEDALKIMQMAIAAKAGAVRTKDFEGKDLMATSTDEVVEYVDKNIGEKEIELYDKYTQGELSSAAEIANEAGESHAVIVKMKGDFPRKIMPQASHSGAVGGQDGVNKALSRGAINYKEPYGESIDLAKWKKIANIKKK